jgi:hypothetical protein
MQRQLVEGRFIDVEQPSEQLDVEPPSQQRELSRGDGMCYFLRPQYPAGLRIPHHVSSSYDHRRQVF